LLAETHKKNKPNNAILYGGLLYDLKPEQLIAESRNGEFRSEKTSRAVDFSDFRYGVKYLPGTKLEVEDIYKRFISKNAECDIITDIAGTEESFKSLALKNIGIIHLATHGFYWSEEDAEERSYVNFLSNMNNKTQSFEDRALLRSGLFFSGANIGLAGENLPNDVEDGVLTAKELSAMNLGNVDMVVMSACQSGLGETSGEGVFGLQRGFKLAGANTLLMSLWKVDDEATRILMTEFYKNYLSGKTKRESLLLAQQTLRKTHPEPEYWASFILLDALN
jgi:CHAT domain-containing protein